MSENKTFSVQVSTTSAKKIGVSSNVSENPITATSDTGLYYSQLAKNWAIGEGLIENTDYSSKAYAQESKAYALDSKAYSESASLDLNNLNNAITQYDEQITNTVATGLAEITTLQESSLLEIGTLRTSAVEDITTNKTNALFDITSAENKALANIETGLNNATNEIQNIANSSIEDINKTGLDTKVSKSGDTMTGVLNFKQSDTVDFTNTNNTVYSEAGTIYFRDKNDEVCGQIRNYFNDYNNLATTIEARRSVNGAIKTSQIQIYVDKDGNALATAPNPPQADSSNKIATTGFCDGKWTAKELVLANNVKLANSGTITYSLANYLPSDNNIYEVIISCAGYFDKGQYNFNTGFYTMQGPYGVGMQVQSSFTTPVSSSKEIRLYPTSICSGDNELTIRVNAYRKVR